jgi:hypothetical protein
MADDERAAFETHLAACAACRAEVRAHTEIVGVLACAAPALPAPDSLRARVLADAGRVRPIGRAHSTFSLRARPWPPDLPDARSPSARWIPRVAAAAGVVLALAALSLHQVERRARADAEHRAATLVTAADSVRQYARRLEAEIAQRDSTIDAIMDGGRTLTLTARGQPPSARIHWNRARGRVIIAARDLPPAGIGRTYQLWAIRAGEPLSLGTFDTDEHGRATVVLRVDPALSFDVTAVTEEPAGGSPLPTTMPLLMGEWPTR